MLLSCVAPSFAVRDPVDSQITPRNHKMTSQFILVDKLKLNTSRNYQRSNLPSFSKYKHLKIFMHFRCFGKERHCLCEGHVDVVFCSGKLALD